MPSRLGDVAGATDLYPDDLHTRLDTDVDDLWHKLGTRSVNKVGERGAPRASSPDARRSRKPAPMAPAQGVEVISEAQRFDELRQEQRYAVIGLTGDSQLGGRV